MSAPTNHQDPPKSEVAMSRPRPTRVPRAAAAIVTVLALTIAAACGGGGSTTSSAPPSTGGTTPAGSSGDPLAPRPLGQRAKLTVAVAGYKAEGFSPLFLADHFGDFEREGLDVEIKVINPADALPAFLTGAVDVYAAGFLANIFNAINGGVDMSWVASVHHSPPTSGMGFWARKDLLVDGKLDPCALKGKKVSLGGATGYAGAGSWSMADFLARCGLTLKDFELSLAGGGDLVIGLEQGAIDVGFLADPAWVPLERSGAAELVVPAYPEPLGGYIVSDLGKERPEVLEAFLRAMLRVTRDRLQGDYKANPETRAALSDELDIPEEAVLATPSLIFEPSLAIDPRPVDEMQRIWYEVGGILEGKPIPSSQVVDMSFVQRVLAG